MICYWLFFKLEFCTFTPSECGSAWSFYFPTHKCARLAKVGRDSKGVSSWPTSVLPDLDDNTSLCTALCVPSAPASPWLSGPLPSFQGQAPHGFIASPWLMIKAVSHEPDICHRWAKRRKVSAMVVQSETYPVPSLHLSWLWLLLPYPSIKPLCWPYSNFFYWRSLNSTNHIEYAWCFTPCLT